MATSVSQNGITVTFDADYPVGQYDETLSYYIVAPSGMSVIGISPASVLVASRPDVRPNADPGAVVLNTYINGAMVNPNASLYKHGFDSAVTGYQTSLNAARPGNADLGPGNPLVLATNSSLMCSISKSSVARPALQAGIVITIVPTTPSAGDLRPPYCGTDKTHNWNHSSMDYGILGTNAVVPSTPSFAGSETEFQYPWFEVITSDDGRYIHPANNQPDYGADMANRVGTAALLLQLDYPDATKKKLFVQLVQYGIDIYGAAKCGTNVEWENNGGHNMGRKYPLVLAGLAFNDSNILAYASGTTKRIFQEDQQTFYVDAAQLLVVPYTGDGKPRKPYKQSVVTVSGTDIIWPSAHGFEANQPMRFTSTVTLPPALDATKNYCILSAGLTSTQFRVAELSGGTALSMTGGSGTLTATMIGVPDWGEKHSSQKTRDGSNWGTTYRDINYRQTVALALAAHLTTGAVTAWDWPPFFDYNDRTRFVNQSAVWSTFVNNMWWAYRGGSTPSGPPTAPTGLTGTAPGPSFIDLAWTNTATNAASQILERGTNGVTFGTVFIIDPTASTYRDSTVLDGRTYYYRVKGRNSQGDSAYATSAAISTPAKAPVNSVLGWSFAAGYGAV